MANADGLFELLCDQQRREFGRRLSSTSPERPLSDPSQFRSSGPFLHVDETLLEIEAQMKHLIHNGRSADARAVSQLDRFAFARFPLRVDEPKKTGSRR